MDNPSPEQAGSFRHPNELLEHLRQSADPIAEAPLLTHNKQWLDDSFAESLKQCASDHLRSALERSEAFAALLEHQHSLTKKPSHRALALLARANALSIGRGKHREAVAAYNQAAEIYEALNDRVNLARSQIGKIGALGSLGEYDKALDIGQWASEILEEHQELNMWAKLLMNMAIIHGRRGEDAKMLSILDRAATRLRQIEDDNPTLWLWIQQNRAVCLRNLGRYEEAISTSKATGRSLETNQRIEAARAHQNLATTYYVQGRYNEAQELLADVLNVFQKDGRTRDAGLVEFFISNCLLKLRRFGDVHTKCCKIRQLFGELGEQQVVAQAYVNEAIASTQLAKYDDALAALAEARKIFDVGNNSIQVAIADLEIATIRYGQQNYELARQIAKQCTQTFLTFRLPIEQAQAILLTAKASLAIGDLKESNALTHTALAIGEDKDVPFIIYQAHQILADRLYQQGDLSSALAAYNRTIDEVERLRNRIMVEFRAEFLSDKQDIYESAVDLCLRLDRLLDGLKYAERAKSRALQEILTFRLELNIQARHVADQPLVDRLTQLRGRRDQLYRRIESNEEHQLRGWTAAVKGRLEAQQEILACEREIEGLWHQLLIRNADYTSDAALSQVIVESPQEYLESDTVLVEYFEIRNQLIVFCVTSESVYIQRLNCSLSDVLRESSLLYLNMSSVPLLESVPIDGLLRNAQGLLQKLYNFLIADIRQHLQGFDNIILVPHGSLHYLPFHALFDGTHYLLEKFQISYLPASSLLRHCLKMQVNGSEMLVLAHSLNEKLPFTSDEARAVADALDSTAYIDEKATINRIQAIANSCRIIHLATHGEFRADNPLFSGLTLADGVLTTIDIFNLRLSASLVTLSACQTGRNVIQSGDELVGLMRAFLAAGAKSLVMSFWPVEDRATAQLMTSFYEHLATGMPKGQALRAAQLQLLSTNSQDADAPHLIHPYYWASFFLTGDFGLL